MTPDDCGFLTSGELDAWIAGDLPEDREAALLEHAESCDACALLVSDRAVFAETLASGPTRSEREAFDARAPMLLARARRESGAAAGGAAGGDEEAAADVDDESWDGARRARRFGSASRIAAVLVVAAVGWFVWQSDPPPGVRLPDGTRVEFEPLPFDAPPEVRGPAGTSERWREAGEAWERGDFRRAAGILDGIEAEDPDDVDATTYAGLARLYLGEAGGAIEVLTRASENARSRGLPSGLIDAHLGLAARAAGRDALATEAFDRAEAAGGPFAERARRWRGNGEGGSD